MRNHSGDLVVEFAPVYNGSDGQSNEKQKSQSAGER
jgi:hypothetical protein